MNNQAVLYCDDLRKSYPQPGGVVEVLKGASLTIQPGELVALIGPSGSGKSTFLHIAGLLDVADSGQLSVFGKHVATASDAVRTRLRRTHMGFIYQAHHLLPELTALENVLMPLRLQGQLGKSAIERGKELLSSMGLEARAQHRPSALSGGEAQRVAIARALVHQPKLILADEPTGNLDAENTEKVITHFINQARQTGASALVVTHNIEVAHLMDKVVQIDNGAITPEQVIQVV